jgi:hypothetical protein
MHLELPLILSYLFTKKIKHTSKINTSDNYKIVINSEVGHKNIIIFSYKNHLDGFCINRNNSYKKIYIITLCNFWYRS